ncbi:hypothetical protein BSNK01_30880 [Bacillaceae bacterium]
MEHQLIIQTECLLFFEENPHAYETAEGLAWRLGRKVEHIQPVLKQLVELSILSQIGTGERALYRYSQPDVTIIR